MGNFTQCQDIAITDSTTTSPYLTRAPSSSPTLDDKRRRLAYPFTACKLGSLGGQSVSNRSCAVVAVVNQGWTFFRNTWEAWENEFATWWPKLQKLQKSRIGVIQTKWDDGSGQRRYLDIFRPGHVPQDIVVSRMDSLDSSQYIAFCKSVIGNDLREIVLYWQNPYTDVNTGPRPISLLAAIVEGIRGSVATSTVARIGTGFLLGLADLARTRVLRTP